MNTRWPAICSRFASLLAWSLLATTGWSQQDLPAVEDGRRFVEVGELALVRTEAGVKPEFVLLDERGEIVASLRPVDGVNLRGHLGEEVGITARMLVDSDTPVLLAETVTTFGMVRELASGDAGGRAELAGYEEALEAVDPVADQFMEGAGVLDPDAMDSPIVPEDYLPYSGAYGVIGCSTCGGRGIGGFPCQTCTSCQFGQMGRMWLRGESLIWWTKGMETPALLVSSPSGTAQRNAGVLGVAGNTTLFGGEPLFEDSRSGGRFRFGKWCGRCNWVGIETDFFFLSDAYQGFRDCTIGDEITGRPFTDAAEGPSAELINFPGLVAGTAAIDAETSLWSINPRLRLNLACEQFPVTTRHDPCALGGYRFDLLLGYRFIRLKDDLAIYEHLMAPTASASGQLPLIPRFDDVTFFSVRDNFATSNDFHGGDVGFAWEGYRGPWSLELISQLGIGSTSQEVTIRGNTARTANGNSFNDPGGLLALESNMGRYSREEFTLIPELNATLGYAVSPRLRFLVGYSFLYWNHVVRAGDQIDTTINTDLLPDVQPTTGPNRPAFSFSDTSFWVQGVSLGLDYRW